MSFNRIVPTNDALDNEPTINKDNVNDDPDKKSSKTILPPIVNDKDDKDGAGGINPQPQIHADASSEYTVGDIKRNDSKEGLIRNFEFGNYEEVQSGAPPSSSGPGPGKNGSTKEGRGRFSMKRRDSEAEDDQAIEASVQNHIPFRSSFLREMLIEDHPGWFSGEEGEKAKQLFLDFCKWLSIRNSVRLILDYGDMQDTYASLDPDSETIQTKTASLGCDGRTRMVMSVLSSLSEVLSCSEFHLATAEDLAHAEREKSVVGFNLRSPDASVIDSRFWIRGTSEEEVTAPYLYFFKRRIKIRVFDRVVLAFQILKPVDPDDEPMRRVVDSRPFWKQMWQIIAPPLGLEGLRDDFLYLKVFKNIPACDLEMLLPGSDVSLTWFELLLIWVPLLEGIGAGIYKAIKGTFSFHDLYQVLTSVLLIAVPLAYGIRAYFSYKARREMYSAHLNRVLLLHCLATNGGVLDELLWEAQEQEDNESLLAYLFLWRGMQNPEPASQKDLDKAIESYIQSKIAAAAQADAAKGGVTRKNTFKKFLKSLSTKGSKKGGAKNKSEKAGGSSSDCGGSSQRAEGGDEECGVAAGTIAGSKAVAGYIGSGEGPSATNSEIANFDANSRNSNGSEKRNGRPGDDGASDDEAADSPTAPRARLDFEVSDAVAKLLRLNLIERVPEDEVGGEEIYYRAVPLEKALELAHVRNFDEVKERGLALRPFGKTLATPSSRR